MMKRLFLILSLFIFTNFTLNTKSFSLPKDDNKEIVDTSFLEEELNDSTLYLALVYYEIKHPKIVLAQAKLESANFTSYHCKVNNNFLGLYNSKKKQYFRFDHWTDCVQGYKDMVEYRLREGENYYNFLRRIGYAEDPSYISKLRKIEKSF